MAKKSKKTASRKPKAKARTGKPARKTAGAKKTARKASVVKAARQKAGAFAKAAGERTKAATKSGTSIVRRTMKALANIASPVIPPDESK